MSLIKNITLVATMLWATPSFSQQLVTEVIPLGFSSAAEIIPVLKPLVPAPGTVTGLYSNLIVRTDAETLAAIKQILNELDRAPRNLLVSVRHGISDNLHQDGFDADIAVGTESAQASIRVFDTRSTTDGQDLQRVRVLEGRQAFIRFGESVPLAQRSLIISAGTLTVQDSVEYQEVNSGFYVLPRVSGDQVVVQIAPERSQLNGLGGGTIDVQRAATTVSGRLGEWIALSGASNRAEQHSTGTVYTTHAYETNTHTMYLRVELVN